MTLITIIKSHVPDDENPCRYLDLVFGPTEGGNLSEDEMFLVADSIVGAGEVIYHGKQGYCILSTI